MLSWACQEALRPCTQDIDYEPSYTQGSNDVHPDDVAMDMDPTLEETTRSQEQPTLSSPGPATSGPATPGSSTSAATPPSAAVSSSAHRYGTRTPGPGAPAWKEEAGGEAQAAAREAERLRSRGKLEQSAEVVKAQLATEGGVIGSPYAARQAKAVATSLFANAGGLANAAKVMGKVAQLPEMRLLALLAEKPEERLTCTNPNPDPIPNPNPNPNPNPDPDPNPNPNPNPTPTPNPPPNPSLSPNQAELTERVVSSIIKFLADHLPSQGSDTRHAGDQNIHDAILTALVDENMVEDRLISRVAKLLGVRWEAVKRAVLRRVKIDKEETETTHGIWTQRKRSVRSDKYELPGFYAFCHDELFFRFISSRSQPLREHTGVGEYTLHWAREALHTT